MDAQHNSKQKSNKKKTWKRRSSTWSSMGTIGSWDRTGPCITLVIPAQTNRNLAIITEPTLDSGHLAKFPSYWQQAASCYWPRASKTASCCWVLGARIAQFLEPMNDWNKDLDWRMVRIPFSTSPDRECSLPTSLNFQSVPGTTIRDCSFLIWIFQLGLLSSNRDRALPILSIVNVFVL